MEGYEYDEEDDFNAIFAMDIDTLRAFYDFLCYSIEMWPGYPRRPIDEQEMLRTMKMQVFSMILEYNLDLPSDK